LLWICEGMMSGKKGEDDDDEEEEEDGCWQAV
jgi:hypothetical protein